MRRCVRCLLLVSIAITLSVPRATSAQDLGLRVLGLRGGFSLSPDQFHFGAFADVGQIHRRIRLQPSVEFGLGDGVRLLAANFDAIYVFGAHNWSRYGSPRPWRPYVGGGPGINFIDVSPGAGAEKGLDFDAEPVLNAVGGVEWGAFQPRPGSSHRYLLEARVGLGDTPDFKLSVGITF